MVRNRSVETPRLIKPGGIPAPTPPSLQPDLFAGPPSSRAGPTPNRHAMRKAKHQRPSTATLLVKDEHLFYHRPMGSLEPRLTEVAYEEVQCKSALNAVKN